MNFLNRKTELSGTEKVVKIKPGKWAILSDDKSNSAEENNEVVIKGVIHDDTKDENGSNGESGVKGKQTSDNDSALDEDDYELLEENLGRKFKRANRFKRLRSMSANESDKDKEAEKEKIAESLFNNADNDNKLNIYLEPLDETRIHPESYEWARKMAIDALEDDLEDNVKVDEIKNYAKKLKKRGFGNKLTTSLDIKSELRHPYRDTRRPYKPLSANKIFNLVSKESSETFYVGKIVQVNVSGFDYKKPQNNQLVVCNPIKDNETGRWHCPFCLSKDFLSLSHAWSHFDNNECPGKRVGVKLRLENGLDGYIRINNFSSPQVQNLDESMINQMILCRVIKVDAERFDRECSTKNSDLADVKNVFKLAKDPHYDHQTEREDKRMEEEEIRKMTMRNVISKRMITHPLFHNITLIEAMRKIKTMAPGECLIIPSTMEIDNLSIIWKVHHDVYQHIDIVEKDKPNQFSLGRRLYIGAEKFDDLDEIITRYIKVMSGYIAEVVKFRHYLCDIDRAKQKAEIIVKKRKIMNPTFIAYIISADKTQPGSFVLSYIADKMCCHEVFSVTNRGFLFRNLIFITLETMINWFKRHPTL